jgi:hypothetical protein
VGSDFQQHFAPPKREGAIDFPNTPFHKLIFISKYRDNSILRDEVVVNRCSVSLLFSGSTLCFRLE